MTEIIKLSEGNNVGGVQSTNNDIKTTDKNSNLTTNSSVVTKKESEDNLISFEEVDTDKNTQEQKEYQRLFKKKQRLIKRKDELTAKLSSCRNDSVKNKIKSQISDLDSQIDSCQSEIDSLGGKYKTEVVDFEGYAYSTEISTDNSAYDEILGDSQIALAQVVNTVSNQSATTTTKTIPQEVAQRVDNKIGEKGFCAKVEQIAQEINCNANDLLALMQSESGLNPKSQSSVSSATGLIQCLSSTLQSVGSSTSQILKMSAIEQLDVVKKVLLSLKQVAGLKANAKVDTGTLYAICFLPAKAKNDVICQAGSKEYANNKGLDIDGNGKITKSDLAARLNKKYKEI